MNKPTVESMKHLYKSLPMDYDLDSIDTISSMERAILKSLWRNEKYLEERYMLAAMESATMLYGYGLRTVEQMVAYAKGMTEDTDPSLLIFEAVLKGESIRPVIKDSLLADFEKVIRFDGAPT